MVVNIWGIDIPPEMTISAAHENKKDHTNFHLQTIRFLVPKKFCHTNSLSNRQIGPQNVFGTDQNNVSKIKVVGRHINAAEFFPYTPSIKNNCISNKS